MKTPEEILDQYLENYPWIYSGKENAIKAMKLYAELYYDSEVKKLNIPAVSNNEERVAVCDWCGEERIVNEDNSCKCCECLDKEQTDC